MRKTKTHIAGVIAVALAALAGLALADGRQLDSASAGSEAFSEQILRTVSVIRYVNPESPFATLLAAPTCDTELTKTTGRIELIRRSTEVTRYDDPEGLLGQHRLPPSCDGGPVEENSYERVYEKHVEVADVFDGELEGLGG